MTYYLVMSKKGSFKGFTNERETLDWFVEQRNIKKYKVIMVDESQLNEKFIKEIHSTYKEIVMQSGTLMFEDEEQIYIDYINNYILQLERSINILSNLLQYTKFETVEEEKIIQNAISDIQDITSYIVDCEDSVEYELFIKVDKMMKEVIELQND